MSRSLRAASGQTTVEWLGVIIVVAALTLTLASSGISDTVAGAIKRELCKVAGGDCGNAPARRADRVPGEPAGPVVARPPAAPAIKGPRRLSRRPRGAPARFGPTALAARQFGVVGDLKRIYDFINDLQGRARTIAGGAICGEAGICKKIFGDARDSPEWLAGEILGGIFALGDVRDAILGLAKGELGEAGLAAIGLVPVAGDAAKTAGIIRKFLKRNPGRLDDAMGIVAKIFGKDSAVTRQILDLVTGGGYGAARRGGLSHEGAEQIVRSGNDLRRLTRNAAVSKRTLSPADRRDLETQIDKHWPKAATNTLIRAEALGVESTLLLLRRDTNIKVILDGRRNPTPQGPDIVAYDKRTGRTIVIEVKGTQSKTKPLDRDRINAPIGNKRYIQPGRPWLDAGQERYLESLLKSPRAGDRAAGRRLERVLKENEPYDARVYNYRPEGGQAYGPGLDQAAEELRRGGGVGRIDIVDVSPA